MSRVVDEIAEEVVKRTPVDTGFARANWRPAINAPPAVPITFNDPTGEATVSRIGAVGRRYRIGDTVYIRNNAPYIERLNEGHSPQAEAGYVEDAIERGFARAISDVRTRGLDL